MLVGKNYLGNKNIDLYTLKKLYLFLKLFFKLVKKNSQYRWDTGALV